jgi:outer membrane protein TolC
MRIFLLGSLLWLAMSPVFAATLSLDQFLSRTLATHPWMKQSAQSYWSTVFRREAADAVYDWNLFASYTFQRGLASEGFTTFSPDTQVDLGKVAVSRMFPGALEIAVVGSYAGYRAMPALLPGLSMHDLQVLGLSLEIKKPLWRNLMGSLEDYPIKLQTYQVQMADIRYQDDLNAFVRQLTDVYLSWYLQHRTVQILRAQMKTAEALLAITRRQAKAGVAEPLDVAQSRQQVLTRRVQTKKAIQLLAQQQVLIQGYLGVSSPLTAAPVLPKLALGLSEKAALEHIKNASNLAQLLDIQVQTQEALLSHNRELNKPALDSFVTYHLGSRQAYGALNGLGGKNTVAAGVTFEMPLNDTVLASLDEANALIRQARFQKEVALRQVCDHLRVAFAAQKTLASQLQEIHKLTLVAKDVARLERETYKLGRSPSQVFVMGAEDRVLDASLQREVLVVQSLQLQNALAAMTDSYRAYTVFEDRQERP